MNRSHMNQNDARQTPAFHGFPEMRRRMVEQQLRGRDITDARVLSTMEQVPREEFVPEPERSRAYEDVPLPIGFGQTISQPYTVAFMIQALELQGTEKVLEIGTGSGYGAAVLSRLARMVHSIERIPELAEQANRRLRKLGYDNAIVHVANGTLGLPDEAPFDRIIVTAGGRDLPESYLEQLAEAGQLLIPLGADPYQQFMYRITRRVHRLTIDNFGPFAFVPLVGRYGWDESEQS